jgi:hypothetical protein
LVTSLTEDQIVKIFESGALSDAQGATLLAIIQNVMASQAPEPRHEPKGSEPQTQSSQQPANSEPQTQNNGSPERAGEERKP